ncbi:Nuclear transport factor 2 [Trinorchestia longiramus]|nr:Nuclear transport factor 2 [Trinorchestia longiramus]
MRHKLAKLYLNDAELIWNGHRMTGGTAIQKFYEELPVSQHTVRCYDSQPVNPRAVGDQTSLLVTTGGFVFFKGKRSDFSQSFLITCHDDKWKVVCDCFRFQQFVS